MTKKNTHGITHYKKEGQEPQLVGKSPPIKDLKKKAKQASSCKAPILLMGENGTGKEVLANLIHYHSNRTNDPMVAVNCGAIPKELVESELFGHEKGAFTGAETQKKGCFEQADNGTLFLDEIGEMSVSLQAKLLRAVELKSFKRVGGEQKVDVDVRIISATNRNLNDHIEAGNFRRDLFYRLNVIELPIPPLRHRKEDIPLLVDHFLNKFTNEYEVELKEFCDTCFDIFMGYDWPGNVRELKNVVEKSIVMSCGYTIDKEILPDRILEASDKINTSFKHDQDFRDYMHIPVGSSLKEIERKAIFNTLSMVGNNKSEAAKILGFSRRTLHNKLEQYKS